MCCNWQLYIWNTNTSMHPMKTRCCVWPSIDLTAIKWILSYQFDITLKRLSKQIQHFVSSGRPLGSRRQLLYISWSEASPQQLIAQLIPSHASNWQILHRAQYLRCVGLRAFTAAFSCCVSPHQCHFCSALKPGTECPAPLPVLGFPCRHMKRQGGVLSLL